MKKNYEKTVLEFTEMMELLLESGLSIRDALEAFVIINSDSATSALGKALLGYIHKGASFAQAVECMDDIFPPIYRGMVKVGDAVGSVERIFPRLGNYLRDRKKLRDKISGALAYPVLVLIVAFLGTLGLIFFVMPKMELIFSGFGGNAGDSIRRNVRTIELGLIIPASIAVFLPSVLGILRKMEASYADPNSFIDRLLLTIPLIGGFVTSWESFNFTFAMEVLTGGGISVEDAILEAAGLVSNKLYRQSLFQVRERVLNGGSLARSFLENNIFPPCLGHWIALGERAGKTERVFAQIRSYFQDELDRRTAKFILLIEPALIALIGILILGLVAGILLPLFSVYGTIL
ncbi:type II secretion system F family protein [Treponema primitia]|uniref:type II secretion system F family protein n=1 Tax=Treponema primitia TaxID=88058 RepID=UPI00025555BE|nr:type II secretion system F family protein [Treponema primitia]